MRPENNKPILLLGIGIFYYLLAATFAFLIQNSLRDLFFNIGGIHPHVNLLICEIIYLAVFILGIFGLLHMLKYKNPNLVKLLFIMIGMVILGQILQFLGPKINSKIHSDNYFPNSSDYYTYLGDNLFTQILIGAFNLLLYISMGYIIFLNRNLILQKNDSIEEIGLGS